MSLHPSFTRKMPSCVNGLHYIKWGHRFRHSVIIFNLPRFMLQNSTTTYPIRSSFSRDICPPGLGFSETNLVETMLIAVKLRLSKWRLPWMWNSVHSLPEQTILSPQSIGLGQLFSKQLHTAKRREFCEHPECI